MSAWKTFEKVACKAFLLALFFFEEQTFLHPFSSYFVSEQNNVFFPIAAQNQKTKQGKVSALQKKESKERSQNKKTKQER